VDDGSTDETANTIAPYRNKIRYIHQSNQGVAASRNTGVRAASGDLVAFLDGDDLWDPEKLAVQVMAHEENSSSGIIVTDGVSFGEAGVRTQSLFRHVHSAFAGNWSSITVRCYRELIRRNLISTVSQIMVPAAVLGAVGSSDASFRVSSDYDLYLRIAARYPITFVRKPLMRWRYVSSSASGPDHLRYLTWSADIIRVLQKQLGEGPCQYHPEIRTLISRMVFAAAEGAYDYGRAGNRSWAAQYLLRLLRHNPTFPSVVFFLVGLSLPHPLARILGRRARRMLKALCGAF
jgi:GT2 family glycosyltransferase